MLMRKSDGERHRGESEERSLKDIVSEAREIGQGLAEDHRKAAENSQLSADLAETTGRVLNNINEEDLGPSFEDLRVGWETHLTGLRRAKSVMNAYPWQAVDSTTSGTALVTSDSSLYITRAHPILPPDLALALSDQSQVISRAANEQKATKLLEEFELDEAESDGKMSPMDQFSTAHEALTRPVSTDDRVASTSLIPMREAINAALDKLLHRASGARLRASDGPNKPYRKVMAILRGLGNEVLAESMAQKLAQDWMGLLGELSDGKTEAMTRDEVRRIVNKATLYIISLLSNLDPTKLN